MKSTKLIPLVVACALFMENTDSTVIATSLPVIAADLGEDPIALKLALTSYLISLAVFIPISGWMADRFGAKTIFRLALGTFMAGSLLCAMSNSLPFFVAARFFQGMGGAMMVPVGRLILLRSVPRSEMVQALAYLSMPAMVGPVIGPPLGGFITTYFDWRWIFFINIPIGLVGIGLASAFFENVREEDVPPLDRAGFVLSGIGLAAFMMGLATAGRHLVPGWVSIAAIVIGAVMLVAYYRHAKAVEKPVLDLKLMRIPTFRVGVLGGSLFRIGIGAIPFLLPLMLQIGFGLDALHSGLLTFASAAGALGIKTISTRIVRRFGFPRVLTVNAITASIFLGASAFFTATTPHLIILGILFVGGCLRSMQFTCIQAMSYADVSNREMSSATSFVSVAQQLSMSMGVTCGAFALEAAGRLSGHAGIQAADFMPAFLAVAALSATSIVFFAQLPAGAGAEVSGHRSSRRITADAVQEQPSSP